MASEDKDNGKEKKPTTGQYYQQLLELHVAIANVREDVLISIDKILKRVEGLETNLINNNGQFDLMNDQLKLAITLASANTDAIVEMRETVKNIKPDGSELQSN